MNSPDGPDATVYWAIVIVRSLSSLSTILLIYYLYKYHQADFQFLQLNRVYLLRSAFWNTQLAWSFALEVLCCVVHEPPFLNHDVDLSIRDAGTRILLDGGGGGYAYSGPIVVRNPWSLLIALRFYVFLRLILSRYYTGGTKILGLWYVGMSACVLEEKRGEERRGDRGLELGGCVVREVGFFFA